MRKSAALLFFAIIAPCAAIAQSTTPAQAEELRRQQYLQTAYALENEVWGRDMPRFANYDVPEQYRGESAVILAQDRDISISAKKGRMFAKIMGGHGGGHVSYSDLHRAMVWINDRSALEYFSDFDFRQHSEEKYGGISNKYDTFMGARIIKPDGGIVNLDINNSAVKVTEGKDDKEAFHRIAIPNLQIGDILDYYFCNVFNLDAGNIADQSIDFYSFDYPVLHLSARISLDGPATLEYRPINGAPDFKRIPTDDGSSVLETAADNPLRLNDTENLRWVSILRSLPMIRFSVFQNDSRSNFVTPGARAAGIHRNVASEKVIEDAAWYMGLISGLIGEKGAMKKDIAAFRAANPSAGNMEIAQYIADRVALEWNFRGYSNHYNDSSFAILLHELLTDNGIECKVGFVSKRSLSRAHEIFYPDDLRCIVTANGDSQIFIYGSHLFHPPWEISGWFAGETATLYANPTIKTTLLPIKNQGLKGDRASLALSLSPDSLNFNKEKMEVKFSISDPALLEISRTSVYTGEPKREIQPRILLREDWDREMRKYLATEDASFIDWLGQKRATRKYRDEWVAQFEKERERQKETMNNEVFSFHGVKPENLNGYTFRSLGVTPAAPALEYTTEYTVRGFVRRAGGDIILEVGKVAGSQWVPTETERNRPIDAWLPCKRLYETEVYIDIPEGYAADESKSFDMRMDNEYGSFSAVVSVGAERIVVKTIKIYKEDYIPVDDFAKLLEMIDAANEFYAKSVILSKKT